jgi:cytidyltransferase-like protein
MAVVLFSGYFDPIHVGHLEGLELAKKLGDRLVVIVNNDLQTALKKGKSFMSEGDRMKILNSIKCVDEVMLAVDEDKSVCDSIRKAHELYDVDIFAKGGDRFSHEIPEAEVCKELGIEIVDGLGEKIRSSSDLIQESCEVKEE